MVTFTLSLAPVSPSSDEAQSSADVDFARMLGGTTDGEGAGATNGEGNGGGPGWVGWLAGGIAVVVASIGYMAYRVLR